MPLQNAGVSDKDMFFAHGNNSNEKGISEIIQRIDKEYLNYKILGYTMTLGTAVSLEKKHFDKVYGFFNGSKLTASEQAQMLFRYRHGCEINIWVSPRLQTLEVDPENLKLDLVFKVKNGYVAKTIDSMGELLDQGFLPNVKGEIPECDLPWLNYKMRLIAQGNASRANPYQSLCDVLEGAGFTLEITCTDDEGTTGSRTREGEALTEAKKDIQEANDLAIANANLLSDEDYQAALKNKGSMNKAKRDELAKTRLHKDTGLEVTKDLVKLERTYNLTSSVENLFIARGNEEQAIAFDLRERSRRQDRADWSFYADRRILLIELGITDLVSKLEANFAYSNSSHEIVEIANAARSKAKEIKNYLGFKISLERVKPKSSPLPPFTEWKFKVSNSQLVGRLLDYVGVKRVGKQSENCERIYSLDKEHWGVVSQILKHRGDAQNLPKIDEFLEVKTHFQTQPETQAGQGLECLTPPVELLYIKSEGGVSQNNASNNIKIKSFLGDGNPNKVLHPDDAFRLILASDSALEPALANAWDSATLMEKVKIAKSLGLTIPALDAYAYGEPNEIPKDLALDFISKLRDLSLELVKF